MTIFGVPFKARWNTFKADLSYMWDNQRRLNTSLWEY